MWDQRSFFPAQCSLTYKTDLLIVHMVVFEDLLVMFSPFFFIYTPDNSHHSQIYAYPTKQVPEDWAPLFIPMASLACFFFFIFNLIND